MNAVAKKTINLKKSEDYLQRAQKVIPAVTQTLSKGPTQFVQGIAPIYLQSGQGSHVFDVDGNEYIDYPGALGPIILGYAHPNTNDAVMRQLQEGITFSLMHPLEVEVAELLTKIIPCADMVRFAKNGSDVTSAAIRVSRAYTGREIIAKCGYHGAQDWHVISTPRNRGVPKFNQDLLIEFQYNNIETLEKAFDQNSGKIAAVIMEAAGIEEPQPGFLEQVKELTHKNGTLLIFDEIKAGFRVALGGAQTYYNVIPDLACFGKAMANGMPISALVGQREIMQELEDVFFSMTFGGEALSLAATLATIQEIQEKRVLDYIWQQGGKLKNGYNNLAQSLDLTPYTQCQGLAPKSLIQFFDAENANALLIKSLFQQEVIKRGILFNGEHMMNFSHSDQDVNDTLIAYEEALYIVAQALKTDTVEKRIEGKKLEDIFKARS